MTDEISSEGCAQGAEGEELGRDSRHSSRPPIEIEIPRKNAGKIAGYSISDLPRFELSRLDDLQQVERGLFTFRRGQLELDFIFRPAQGKKLFVLLSGAVDREQLQPPVFHRWSWANYFPGSCLYIADPTIKLNRDLSLGWYIGNKDEQAMPHVAKIIRHVARLAGVLIKDVIVYGSSGGGFAGLQLLKFLPKITVLTINPQTDVTKYHSTQVENFLRHCFDGISSAEALQTYGESLSVLFNPDHLQGCRILYVQNRHDEHHLVKHFGPFANALGLNEENGFSRNLVSTFFFDNPAGHSKAEQPELFPVLLDKAIRLSDSGRF